MSVWQRQRFLALFLILITAVPAGLAVFHFFPDLKTPLPNQDAALDSVVTVQPHKSWNEFIALSDWVMEHTPKDALFLVPPSGFEVFRITAERGIVVSYKDGSTLILTQDDGGQSWQDRYTTVRDAYLANKADVINKVAGKYRAEYIIVDVTKNPLPFTPLYRNARYAAYAPPLTD